jgi:hypothetical protein
MGGPFFKKFKKEAPGIIAKAIKRGYIFYLIRK